jgi:hypothetical protein
MFEFKFALEHVHQIVNDAENSIGKSGHEQSETESHIHNPTKMKLMSSFDSLAFYSHLQSSVNILNSKNKKNICEIWISSLPYRTH